MIVFQFYLVDSPISSLRPNLDEVFQFYLVDSSGVYQGKSVTPLAFNSI